MQNILETQIVRKTYQNAGQTINAVDDVSIEVRAGEFIALVGPSGSGKTTLLALLAGLLKPTAGNVLIDSVPLWGNERCAAHPFPWRKDRVYLSV